MLVDNWYNLAMKDWLNYDEVTQELGISHTVLIDAISKDFGLRKRYRRLQREPGPEGGRARYYLHRNGFDRIKQLIKRTQEEYKNRNSYIFRK